MNLLKRELAPILPAAWEQIDQQARLLLHGVLAGRRVVDVKGPAGWRLAAVDTGRLLPLERKGPVTWSYREVKPLVELRAPFSLSIAELDAVGRGDANPDLEPVEAAARAIATAENAAIFEGVTDVGIGGILKNTPNPRVPIETSKDYPRAAAHAADILRRDGIDGPYALVLGPTLYEDVFANADDGYPLAKRLRHLVEDRIVRAPEMSGGVFIAVRGGDYELSLGQDLSIGYSSHDAKTVHLHIVESFTFRVLQPSAAVPLHRAS